MATEPLPGEPGSHAWTLDLLAGLGADLKAQNALVSWSVSRGDKWATLSVQGKDIVGQLAWRLVPVDRDERRKVDGSAQ